MTGSGYSASAKAPLSESGERHLGTISPLDRLAPNLAASPPLLELLEASTKSTPTLCLLSTLVPLFLVVLLTVRLDMAKLATLTESELLASELVLPELLA